MLILLIQVLVFNYVQVSGKVLVTSNCQVLVSLASVQQDNHYKKYSRYTLHIRKQEVRCQCKGCIVARWGLTTTDSTSYLSSMHILLVAMQVK